MAETEAILGRKESLPLINGISGDPLNLRLFAGDFPEKSVREARKDEETGAVKETVLKGFAEEGVELSLGLSLNGKFGFDPNRAHNMKRSSSISNLAVRGGEGEARGLSAHARLPRACSDGETEEWRRKKEAQTQKRMEAKRKRVEKLNHSVRVVKERREKEEKGNGNIGKPLLPSNSQGSSIASQGSGSSGVSDFESQPLPVSLKNEEATRSASDQSEEEGPMPPAPILEPPTKNSENPVTAPAKDNNEALRNLMMNMPCVSTKGDGPNGKKIEGFLYRYKKGEEVRIMCVCHGSFLSPAEFVKHAGGTDVTNPLKHIIVTPSCFF
ncbi:unnamed protein product [Cuscuta epithymum]|uniref:Ninja-family protein n=1 Tax=Cuscuta epithymum TaxID=186058 RepID=A0AAV0D5K5_9ASTE|nr:unnamed protein product [Cuscuta epithymum]